MVVMDFEQFCARFGYPRPLDDHSMFKMPHGFTKRYRREPLKRLKAGLRSSAQAWAFYSFLVETGQVRPPTSQEVLEDTAQGHPDNQAVQAAQRVLAKRAARRR